MVLPPTAASHHPPALLLVNFAGWSLFLGLPAPFCPAQGVAFCLWWWERSRGMALPPS